MLHKEFGYLAFGLFIGFLRVLYSTSQVFDLQC